MSPIEEGNRIDFNGYIEGPRWRLRSANAVTANIELSLKRVMELLDEARERDRERQNSPQMMKELRCPDGYQRADPDEIDIVVNAGGVVLLSGCRVGTPY